MYTKNFVWLLKNACAVLNLSVQEISQKLHEYPMCVMDHIEKGERAKSVEVEFKDEQGTLTILFDKNEKADFVFLHPEGGVDDLDEIFVYLGESNDYDYIKNHWRVGHSCVAVRSTDEGILFVVYKSQLMI